MNKFPFFDHHAIKIIFHQNTKVDEELINNIATILIKSLKLTIVKEGRYEFPNGGLTKFWILSQSHLIVHSWPENFAIHIDLMTCSKQKNIKESINKSLDIDIIKRIQTVKLHY